VSSSKLSLEICDEVGVFRRRPSPCAVPVLIQPQPRRSLSEEERREARDVREAPACESILGIRIRPGSYARCIARRRAAAAPTPSMAPNCRRPTPASVARHAPRTPVKRIS
jgi:hypothetical protein